MFACHVDMSFWCISDTSSLPGIGTLSEFLQAVKGEIKKQQKINKTKTLSESAWL